MNEDEAVQAVVKAWNDAGISPTYHYRHKLLLRTNWPVLALALDNLTNATKDDNS